MKKIILILLIIVMAFSGSAMLVPIPNVGKSPPPENTTIISTIFQANPVVAAIVSPCIDIAPALPFVMFGQSELQAIVPDRTSWAGPTCGHNNMTSPNEETATPTDPIVREKRFLGAGDSFALGYAELAPLTTLSMSGNIMRSQKETSQTAGNNTVFRSLKRFLGAGDSLARLYRAYPADRFTV